MYMEWDNSWHTGNIPEWRAAAHLQGGQEKLCTLAYDVIRTCEDCSEMLAWGWVAAD